MSVLGLYTERDAVHPALPQSTNWNVLLYLTKSCVNIDAKAVRLMCTRKL